MTQFDRSYTIAYQSAIISKAVGLSCTIFEIFYVEEYYELEI